MNDDIKKLLSDIKEDYTIMKLSEKLPKPFNDYERLVQYIIERLSQYVKAL